MANIKSFILVLLIALHTQSALAQSLFMEVYKSPQCGCCNDWIDHLRENGIEVRAHDLNNMQGIKSELDITPQFQSCHTGLINGYFIEGHVPADDIKKLIADSPDVKGLSVPGMPAGSNVPGMETRPEKATFDVFAIGEDEITIFNRYGE